MDKNITIIAAIVIVIVLLGGYMMTQQGAPASTAATLDSYKADAAADNAETPDAEIAKAPESNVPETKDPSVGGTDCLGDINQDGVTNDDDVTFIEDYVAGSTDITDDQKACIDVNMDGAVTQEDANCVNSFIIGNIQEWVICRGL